MSEAVGERAGNIGALAFLKEALRLLKCPDLRLPALILLVLLTVSNIVVLQNMPAKGSVPALPFILAAVVRVLGVIVLAVAVLRTLSASERPRWRPDGGMFLYAATFALALAAQVVAGRLVGDRTELVPLILTNLLATLILAPLVVWFVAIAVVRPLAWRPGPWLRGFADWLPHWLLWSILLVTPLAVLHARIDLHLIRGAGEHFWPLALFDGALSTAMALLGLALGSVAYRRVAQA